MKWFLSVLVFFSLLLPSSSYAIRFDPTQIALNVSMGASFNSTVLDLDYTTDASITAVWTGSPVGSLKLQISNDIVDVGTSVVNWIDYTDSTYAVTAAGSFVWNISRANYRWLRVSYTRTSGTGTMNMIAGRKQ